MADNARQLLVKVVVDTDKAEKGLKKVSDSTDKFKKSADKASDEVKDLGKNTKTAGENAEKTAKQTDKLSDSTKDATKKFGGLKDSVDNLTGPFKTVHSSLEGVNKLLGLVGITVGLGTVANLIKNAAEEAHTLRVELESSTTTLSTITGKTDTTNLQTIRDKITKTDLGITSTDAASVIGQVSKYIGGSDTDIQNISQKILVLQKMGTDVDIKKLSENMDAAGIGAESIAEGIDMIYSAASETKLTFSEFVDDVELLTNLTASGDLKSVEEFYRTIRSTSQEMADYGTKRANADTAIPDDLVRMYGVGSGASFGRVFDQIGEDWKQASNELYKQTGNDIISNIGAAIFVAVEDPIEKTLGNVNMLYQNTVGNILGDMNNVVEVTETYDDQTTNTTIPAVSTLKSAIDALSESYRQLAAAKREASGA